MSDVSSSDESDVSNDEGESFVTADGGGSSDEEVTSLQSEEKSHQHITLHDEDDAHDEADDDASAADDTDDEEYDSELDGDILPSTNANSGWADAMRKILFSKKEILSKAAKDKVRKSEDKAEFEVVGEKLNKDALKSENGDNKDDKVKAKCKVKVKVDRSDAKKSYEWNMYARTKPSVLERNHERRLAKVATRGVVQLFNAIRTQQKEDSGEVAEGKEKKRKHCDYKQMDKDSFLDMLKGSTGNHTKTKAGSVKVKEEDDDYGGDDDDEGPGWDVLQDDYMMGGKLGDWEQDSDSEG